MNAVKSVMRSLLTDKQRTLATQKLETQN